MLTLTRKKNESIIINDDIKIMVVEVRGDKVRLGIEAPRGIMAHRQEIWEQIMDRSFQTPTPNRRVK